MTLQSNPVPSEHKADVGSPYCSDPNCQYCVDLRAVQAQLRGGLPIKPSEKDSAA
jgi:hypothetical protein